jgi:galactokinase
MKNGITKKLKQSAKDAHLPLENAQIRRTSSRFCLGIEHGDYNGTKLFGVGTNRFIWMAYKPNNNGKNRLFSGNFPDDGLVEFEIGKTPPTQSEQTKDSWARFAWGADFVLGKHGYKLQKGIDAVIYGNIPGGGMSRSASLSLNLLLSLMQVNNIKPKNDMQVIDMAVQIENEYIGSPCGKLDQIMIYFARDNQGVHYDPSSESVKYIPFGGDSEQFRLVSLDTGTVRPGLEKSTYKIRRQECDDFTALLKEKDYKINSLADIKEPKMYQEIIKKFQSSKPNFCRRLKYIYEAQKRFEKMLGAWKKADIETVGEVFRKDGIGLRDDYRISGSQLESMCDIARTVDGVLGERMLGGGDKGAAGAIVKTASVEQLKQTVETAYPKSHPDYADKFDVHSCKVVDGIKVLKEPL